MRYGSGESRAIRQKSCMGGLVIESPTIQFGSFFFKGLRRGLNTWIAFLMGLSFFVFGCRPGGSLSNRDLRKITGTAEYLLNDPAGQNLLVLLTNGTPWKIAQLKVAVWTAIEERVYSLTNQTIPPGTAGGELPASETGQFPRYLLAPFSAGRLAANVGSFIEGKEVNSERYRATLAPEQRQLVLDHKLLTPEEKRRNLILAGLDPGRYDLPDGSPDAVPRTGYAPQANSVRHTTAAAGEWRWAIIEARTYK